MMHRFANHIRDSEVNRRHMVKKIGRDIAEFVLVYDREVAGAATYDAAAAASKPLS